MPPPPPPSASYLWNWDDYPSTSSEDEDDDLGETSMPRPHGDDRAPAKVLTLDAPPSRTSTTSARSTPANTSSSTTDAAKVVVVTPSRATSGIEPHPTRQTTSSSSTMMDDNPQHRSRSSDTLTTSVERIQNAEQERFFQQQPQPQQDDDDASTMEKDLRLLLSEDEEEETASSRASNNNNNNKRLSKAQRKRNNKKKGQKKNKTAPTITTTADVTTTTIPQQQQQQRETKNVSFGTVTVHLFERCLGVDVVPGDGGWPLGMERVAHPPAASLSIHDYETEQQERLKVRWYATTSIQPQQQQDHKSIRHDHRKQADCTSTSTCTAAAAAAAAQQQDFTVTGPLETRQFDYRRGAKNPLFRMLTESERMNLLLAASSTDEEPDNTAGATKHPLSSSCGERRRSTQRSRSRSGSFSENNTNHNSAQPHPHRPRSNSNSFSNVERYNDGYPQTAVHHVRNELEQIRHARTKEGATGCTCRKLHVYLVPPDGGKKAHHRRLKLSKVKEELRKRHALSSPAAHEHDHMSREALEQWLHDLVEAEPCCSTASDCPCARDGVGCQADACTCWHASHLTKQQQQQHGSDASSFVPSMVVQERCGNPSGMYVVDLDQINAVRRQFWTAMTVCPVIGGSGTTAT